ncbi:erythromycin esterase family protein [Spirosoma horti]
MLCSGCKKPDSDPTADLTTDQRATVESLNKVIFPIQDADPDRDFTELAPLDTVLAKAQVVGMGEGTHGTREFFQMKDRLFRYLVQKHGYRTIAFEANFGRSVVVNRFIHGQTTELLTASAAAKSMYFWTWSTDEVRALLQWMKAYNAGKPSSDQLSFYGFDCQYADDEFPLLDAFLLKVAPALLTESHALASLARPVGGSPLSDSSRQTYSSGLLALYNQFVTNEMNWVASAGRESYEIARQAARVLIQQQEITNAAGCAIGTLRDRYMAENVQWLQNRMGIGKVSLWAHNAHISTIPYQGCGLPSMGSYLKQQLQGNYVTVCTLLTNGMFTVRDASQSNSPLSTLSIRTDGVKTSYNYLFGKAQWANFILNLNGVPQAPVLTTWLTSTHPLFELGASFNETEPEHYYNLTALQGRFDVLIHFRDTSPTQLLP